MNFDKRFKYNKPNIDPYVFVSIVSFLLCVQALDYSDITSHILKIKIALAIMFLVVCLGIIYNYRIDYAKEKKKYIEQWQEIRLHELGNKIKYGSRIK